MIELIPPRKLWASFACTDLKRDNKDILAEDETIDTNSSSEPWRENRKRWRLSGLNESCNWPESLGWMNLSGCCICRSPPSVDVNLMWYSNPLDDGWLLSHVAQLVMFLSILIFLSLPHAHFTNKNYWRTNSPCWLWCLDGVPPSLPLCPCSSPTSSWRRGTSWAPFSTYSLTTTVSLIRTGPLSSAFYSRLNDATFAAARRRRRRGQPDGRGQWPEKPGWSGSVNTRRQERRKARQSILVS